MENLHSKASLLVERLTQLNKNLSTAESCTGGLIASSITNVSGASKIFLGGFIVYATEMKKKLLGIESEIFEYGVISPQMALEMAKKVRNITGSNFSIATTGNLGPEVMEGKPRGLIYIAVADEKDNYVRELLLNQDRISNKIQATIQAINMLLQIIPK